MKTMIRDDSGQAIVEYALILALVAILALAGLHALGNRVSNTLAGVNVEGSATCTNNGGQTPQGNAYGVCGK